MDEVEIRPPLSAGNMDLKKGTWSAEEDQKLIAYIRRYGIWNWAEMSKAVGLSRSGQSCRLRWMNYLRPDIKHGNFTDDEEETIVNLYEKVGSRRSTMAESLPGRTDDEIKSCFDTIVRNKALQTEELRDDQTPELESKEMATTSDNNLSNTKLLMTENAPRGTEKGLRHGRWTGEEDKKLIAYITKYGNWNWRALPKFAGLARSGKSCRLRWMNYLRPGIKRGKFSVEEEETICRLHEILGNKWSVIASHLPGRTDNEIKNYFKTYLKKRVYKKNEEWEDALQGTVNETSPIPTITYSDEAKKYFDEEASSPHGGPSVDSLVEKAIKSVHYYWLPFLDHKNSELESREIPSSSSNNLSALLMSPKESNCRSNMEIPNYNLIKEEIINNGNQIKLVEKMVGLPRSSRKIEQQFSMEEEAYVLAADDEDASPSYLLKSVVQLSLSPVYLSRLNMPQSNPEELWAGKQSLVNLKSIDLNHSKLTKIPDLSEAQKLGRLNLRGCLNLLETSSIQYLTKLEFLNLKGCKSLKNLPCMKGLSVLTTVILSDCSNLKQLPELSKSIENLYLDGTAIEELPSSIGCLSGLVKLDLRNCTRLRLLPSSISELQLLEYLDISGCSLLLQLLEMDWNDMWCIGQSELH